MTSMPSGLARVCTTSIVCGWHISETKNVFASADDRMTKRHRLGRGGRFVEQRGICDIERGQVGDHRLKIEQRFEAALRNLGLVRRVGRVPAGIFQNVALDDRRHDAIGVAGPNEVAHHLVLLRDLAQFGQRFLFRFARGQVKRIRSGGYLSGRSRR